MTENCVRNGSWSQSDATPNGYWKAWRRPNVKLLRWWEVIEIYPTLWGLVCNPYIFYLQHLNLDWREAYISYLFQENIYVRNNSQLSMKSWGEGCVGRRRQKQSLCTQHSVCCCWAALILHCKSHSIKDTHCKWQTWFPSSGERTGTNV